ncbi:hypothetical protein GS942_21330 [Rhodococcus hoagii]|nr:hypothetical protein [Prescottella equi]
MVREPATRRVARGEKTKKISGRTSIWSAVSTCWIGAPVLAWADVVGGAQTVFAATLSAQGSAQLRSVRRLRLAEVSQQA